MRLKFKCPLDFRHNRRAAFGVGSFVRGKILINLVHRRPQISGNVLALCVISEFSVSLWLNDIGWNNHRDTEDP